MKIGILGAGSIGMHLAAQLHMAGQDVTLICRTIKQVERLVTEGLVYESYDGEKTRLRIPVISEKEAGIAFDILLITLKQTDLHLALNTLSKSAAFNPAFVCFQNGMGHEEFFVRHFPQLSLFLAVTTEGALRESLNAVRHTGKGTTWIGTVNHLPYDPRTEIQLRQIVRLFSDSTMKVETDVKIDERIWKKLLVNSCINPLTAIFQVRNGQLVESPSSLAVMERIFQEGKRIAELEGIKIEQEFLQEIVAVCRNTYHNKSSMLQDVEAGRKTEIEYINGAILRAAERHGLSVPHNNMVIDMIIAMQDWGKGG